MYCNRACMDMQVLRFCLVAAWKASTTYWYRVRVCVYMLKWFDVAACKPLLAKLIFPNKYLVLSLPLESWGLACWCPASWCPYVLFPVSWFHFIFLSRSSCFVFLSLSLSPGLYLFLSFLLLWTIRPRSLRVRIAFGSLCPGRRRVVPGPLRVCGTSCPRRRRVPPTICDEG
jgi:hypothetical protein